MEDLGASCTVQLPAACASHNEAHACDEARQVACDGSKATKRERGLNAAGIPHLPDKGTRS